VAGTPNFGNLRRTSVAGAGITLFYTRSPRRDDHLPLHSFNELATLEHYFRWDQWTGWILVSVKVAGQNKPPPVMNGSTVGFTSYRAPRASGRSTCRRLQPSGRFTACSAWIVTGLGRYQVRKNHKIYLCWRKATDLTHTANRCLCSTRLSFTIIKTTQTYQPEHTARSLAVPALPSI